VIQSIEDIFVYFNTSLLKSLCSLKIHEGENRRTQKYSHQIKASQSVSFMAKASHYTACNSQGESASGISRMALGMHGTVFCITNI